MSNACYLKKFATVLTLVEYNFVTNSNSEPFSNIQNYIYFYDLTEHEKSRFCK